MIAVDKEDCPAMCETGEKPRRSLLEATTNTRRVTLVPAGSGAAPARHSVWRSDAPVRRLETDEALLKQNGITTLIDLRTEAETRRKPCAYADRAGFLYRPMPVTEGAVPPATLEEVPASYMRIALQPGMDRVFRFIAEAEDGVMVCCTAGKDRTGVVSALLQLTCGVDHGTIIADYAVSREYNRVRLERFLAEHPEVDRQVVLASEISMKRFIALLLDRFGDMDAYYRTIGLGAAEIRRLRETLAGPSSRRNDP